MIQIEDLISRLEAVQNQFGNTCVYIRRGGMGWGAVALNRRDDDQKNGVFDMQAQHDRDMQARLEQIGRLRADREEAWRLRRDAEGSRDAARAACDSMRIERDAMRKALVAANQFITNGVDLGYIRMPDPQSNDAALLTPGIVRAALAASEGSADAS
jgi:hypothetical protein